MTDKVSLESFVKGCKTLKDVFEKVKQQNLVIKVKEIQIDKLPNHGHMLPIKLFEDYALVRDVIHNEQFEVLSIYAIHPYGSSKYYTLHKRPSNVEDSLKS